MKLEGLAAGAVAPAVFGVGAATARADAPTLGADGTTAPVYSYADAIRERVFVPVPGVDQVAITFGQHIAANDALRTGMYSQTLTFTLSTSTP